MHFDEIVTDFLQIWHLQLKYYKKMEFGWVGNLLTCVQTCPPPSEKIGRRDVCEWLPRTNLLKKTAYML